MQPTPTAPLAALSLVLGFVVAELTGVRAAGGAVLLAGLAACVWLWRERVGAGRAASLAALFLGLFVVSHLLARAAGAWPSVLMVAAAMSGATYLLADRSRDPSRV